MHRPQQMVQEFHRVIGQPTSPAKPELRAQRLGAQLLLEEAIETAFALVGSVEAQNIVQDMLLKVLQEATQKKETEPDLCRAIDGLCDTIVICYGRAETLGVDLEPFYDEVMAANMTKANGPIDANGKRGKPPGFVPPDIAGVLERVMEARS